MQRDSGSDLREQKSPGQFGHRKHDEKTPVATILYGEQENTSRPPGGAPHSTCKFVSTGRRGIKALDDRARTPLDSLRRPEPAQKANITARGGRRRRRRRRGAQSSRSSHFRPRSSSSQRCISPSCSEGGGGSGGDDQLCSGAPGSGALGAAPVAAGAPVLTAVGSGAGVM